MKGTGIVISTQNIVLETAPEIHQVLLQGRCVVKRAPEQTINRSQK